MRKTNDINSKRRLQIEKNINNYVTDKEILALLEDCISLNFYPQLIQNICENYVLLYKDIDKKTLEPIKRKLYFYSKYIVAFKEYKFAFCLGATLELRRFYSDKDYSDVWNKVHQYIIDEFNGAVVSVFCYEIDGINTNAFRTFNGFFTPKEGKFSSIKADDISPNWRVD